MGGGQCAPIRGGGVGATRPASGASGARERTCEGLTLRVEHFTGAPRGFARALTEIMSEPRLAGERKPTAAKMMVMTAMRKSWTPVPTSTQNIIG